MTITDRLLELADPDYGDFHAKLLPGIPRESIIGVRVPKARELAKEYRGSYEAICFLDSLPHLYYDENMFHGILISQIKDYEECIEAVERFLPYVDNWAVCDTLSPKVFARNKDRLISKIKEWITSDDVYTCRFGIEMLMSFYLDGDFKNEYLELPAAVHKDEYYVKMMIAWFYATALSKQWDATVPYIENRILDPWVHNKTIQKARESFRITDKQKEYLNGLKVQQNNKKV